jgi:hypothetical protein
LADRWSFRRFCSLELDDAVPDGTALFWFWIDLAKAGLAKTAFNVQLKQYGVVIKVGTMIDATLVEADAKPVGTIKNSVRWCAVAHDQAMSLVKRSPNRTAKWALAGPTE